MIWLHFAIASLAAARIVRLLTVDALGAKIFRDPLLRAMSRHVPVQRQDFWGDALWCRWCVGFWVCLAVFCCTALLPWGLTAWLFGPWAFAYIVGLIGGIEALGANSED